MRITRRRVAGVIGVVLGVVLLWTPSLVARTYTSAAQPIEFLTRPDKGWRFLYDAVRVTRDAKLGSEGPALQAAKRFWRRAERVELVYLERPVTVPVARGAVDLPARLRTVRPRSRFTWFVYGTVGRGPRQVIGLMDLKSGRVFWDIRRVTGEVAR